MKKIVLVFLVLFFWGCSDIDYPKGFVKLVNFPHKEIIDIEYRQINSKDELVSYFQSTVPLNYQGTSFDYRNCVLQFFGSDNQFRYNGEYWNNKYLVYINPLSNNKPVLNKDDYNLGMPIELNDTESGFDTTFGIIPNIQRKSYTFVQSKQPIILIKGKSEWADSSYQGFTILPVCNSGDENDLDFTWTVKKEKRN
jgi:hypothetical protein